MKQPLRWILAGPMPRDAIINTGRRRYPIGGDKRPQKGADSRARFAAPLASLWPPLARACVRDDSVFRTTPGKRTLDRLTVGMQ